MNMTELRQMGAQDAAANEDTETIAEGIRDNLGVKAAAAYRKGAGI